MRIRIFLNFEIPLRLSLLTGKFVLPPVLHIYYCPGERGRKTRPWEGAKHGVAPIRHKGEVKEVWLRESGRKWWGKAASKKGGRGNGQIRDSLCRKRGICELTGGRPGAQGWWVCQPFRETLSNRFQSITEALVEELVHITSLSQCCWLGGVHVLRGWCRKFPLHSRQLIPPAMDTGPALCTGQLVQACGQKRKTPRLRDSKAMTRSKVHRGRCKPTWNRPERTKGINRIFIPCDQSSESRGVRGVSAKTIGQHESGPSLAPKAHKFFPSLRCHFEGERKG